MPKRTYGEREDPRRAFLLKALAAGVLAAGGWTGGTRAQVLGRRPQPLPPGQTIYETTGPVTVNGQRATAATRIGPTDRIETGKGAQLIFVVGADAFIVRENTRVELSGSGALIRALRVVAGGLLSVFGSGSKQVHIATAELGIRGTGLYVESQPDQSYVCTCYGELLITAADDRAVTERIVSTHHDAPRYVVKAGTGRRIRPAPFINHSDLELMLIESLVGRKPPFSLFDEDYGGTRRY